MKKTLMLFCAVGSLLTTTALPAAGPAIPRNEKIERQVEKQLRRMTLDEKVGQMCELSIDLLQKRVNPFAGMNPHTATKADIEQLLKKYGIEKEFDLSDGLSQETMMGIYMRIMAIENANGFQLDEAMLDTVIGTYKVGSILNVPASVAQTPEKWQEIIRRIQEKSMETMGIPCIYGVDQIHGTTYTQGGTFFPQGVNMGATFNRGLTREGARISAYETKAGSIPWTYAPVVDLGRDPRWPRMWENYGEDCYLNAEMGREAVVGFQGEDPNHVDDQHVAACMKHYMGYGVPVSGKDRTPSSITVQDLREKHFAPYLEMAKAGALSLMVNSSMNNGLPMHANYELLTVWLKEGLDWDGMIVTDWADINNLYTRDHIAKDKKEAIKLAINAGIDMSMDPYDWKFCTLLKELVEEGEVPMSRIDDAVRRILRLKYRLNLFEKPYYEVEEFPLFGSEEHAAAALQAAEESLVLLKNADGILPLAKGTKLLVTGPNANSMRTLNGGWSYSWQGDKADACAAQYNTILEALTEKFGAENVVYEAGVTYAQSGNWWDENAPEIEKAVAAAADVDCIVACIGENSYCETPGNLTDLTLSQNQSALVEALARTGKPIVLILNEGRPRLVAKIEPLAKAVVDVMLPGNYGGDALANLLSGDANFSGKLPFTYPREINSLITYDYKPCEHIGKQMEGAYNYDAQVAVQWAFGYGLSYTRFAYDNFRVDKSSFTADDTLTFAVDVTNCGDRAGKEVVQLYIGDRESALPRPVKELKGFRKVRLAPGETRTVEFVVTPEALSFYDAGRHAWKAEAGQFDLSVGSSSADIRRSVAIRYEE